MTNIKYVILNLFKKCPDRYINSGELRGIAPDYLSSRMGSHLSRLFFQGFLERIKNNDVYWYKPTEKGISSTANIQIAQTDLSGLSVRMIRSLQCLNKLNTWATISNVNELVERHHGVTSDNLVFVRLLHEKYVERKKSGTGRLYLYILTNEGKKFLGSDVVGKIDMIKDVDDNQQTECEKQILPEGEEINETEDEMKNNITSDSIELKKYGVDALAEARVFLRDMLIDVKIKSGVEKRNADLEYLDKVNSTIPNELTKKDNMILDLEEKIHTLEMMQMSDRLKTDYKIKTER